MYPFPTLEFLIMKNLSETFQKSYRNRNFEYCRIKIPTKTNANCSPSAFAKSGWYSWWFTFSRRLKSLRFRALPLILVFQVICYCVSTSIWSMIVFSSCLTEHNESTFHSLFLPTFAILRMYMLTKTFFGVNFSTLVFVLYSLCYSILHVSTILKHFFHKT